MGMWGWRSYACALLQDVVPKTTRRRNDGGAGYGLHVILKRRPAIAIRIGDDIWLGRVICRRCEHWVGGLRGMDMDLRPTPVDAGW